MQTDVVIATVVGTLASGVLGGVGTYFATKSIKSVLGGKNVSEYEKIMSSGERVPFVVEALTDTSLEIPKFDARNLVAYFPKHAQMNVELNRLYVELKFNNEVGPLVAEQIESLMPKLEGVVDWEKLLSIKQKDSKNESKIEVTVDDQRLIQKLGDEVCTFITHDIFKKTLRAGDAKDDEIRKILTAVVKLVNQLTTRSNALMEKFLSPRH
jgi:hypothetical protein